MFISDKIIYLQMQKTGSTHVTHILEKCCGGQTLAKHDPLRTPGRYAGRTIISSIRNPWAWYVSLWAFGCAGDGRLRKYLDNLPRSELRQAAIHRDLASAILFFVRLLTGRPEWGRLYVDPGSEANFREWLKLILGPEGLRMGLEGYASSSVKKAVGFLTYRFLALTTDYTQWMNQGRKCRSYDEVTVFADEHTIVSHVLRAESLDADLRALLDLIGLEVSADEASQWGRHNAAPHRNHTEYYDEETIMLVATRDRFILDRFGYRWP